MKIEIDASKISTSCECIDKDIIKFDEELDNKVNQLKYKLLNNNKSCYLISGYRGTGKSTFIKEVESRIRKENDKNIIFVNINLSKYESYSVLLRKLTRGIYFSLIESGQYETIKSEENQELISQVENLYRHTFYEVYKTESITKTKETSLSIASNVAHNTVKFKFVASSTALITAISGWLANQESIIKSINQWVCIISIACFLFMDFKHENKKLDKEEEGSKSLYDDEIAEYRFIELINEFNKKNIGITFVIDELDKIEDDSELDRFISDLKPMMLSDLANFIIISGQKLYYKVNQSSSNDDSIYRSIFNDIIHIPLMGNMNLINLFKSYSDEEKIQYNLEVDNYIYSLILESGRITREFKNLILRDTKSKDGKSYLHIDSNLKKSYEIDFTLSYIINEIVTTEIYDSIYDEGIKDFLISQLFIWVKRIKTKHKYKYFDKSDIFNLNNQYKDPNLAVYINILEDLYDILLEKLKSKNIIELSKNQIRLSYLVYSSYNKPKIEFNVKFAKSYVDILKSIYLYLFDYDNNFKDTKFRAKDILNELNKMNIVNLECKEAQEAYLLDKIEDNRELSEDEIRQIKVFKRYKSILTYKFAIYLIKNSLEGHNYKFYKPENGIDKRHSINKNFLINCDIFAESNPGSGLKNIIFEIKDFTSYTSLKDDMIMLPLIQLDGIRLNLKDDAIGILIIYINTSNSIVNSTTINSIYKAHNLKNIYILYINIHNSNNLTIGNITNSKEVYSSDKFKQELLSIINSNVINEVASDKEINEIIDKED